MKKIYIPLFLLVFIVSFFSILRKNEPKTVQHVYNGKEIALIYIGNSRCMFCSDPNLKKEINNISGLMVDFVSNKDDIGLKKIGISIDLDPHEGYLHLNDITRFDEIITGNGWANLGSLRYIYSELGYRPATPQILFSLRKFNEVTNVTTTYRGIKSEEIILSLTGLDEIQRFDLNDVKNLTIAN
jgi:hypothetical protein